MITKVELMYRDWPQIPEVLLQDRSGEFVRLMDFSGSYSVDREWVRSQLEETVRLGTGAEDRERLYPPRKVFTEQTIQEINIDSFSLNHPIVPSMQVYNRLVNEKGLDSKQFDTSAKILTILLDKNFRNGSLNLLSSSYVNALHTRIVESIDQLRPIELVLPTLPFKDQNPLTTSHSASFVDLGEYLFLSRLGRLSQSVSEVYASGLTVHIVADGSIYSDIFLDGQKDSASVYAMHCLGIIDQLGLSKRVDVTHLENLVRLDSMFTSVQETIIDYLEDSDAHSYMLSLTRGVLFNMQLPYDYERFVHIVSLSEKEFMETEPVQYRKVREAALQYASFLLTMKKLHILHRAFPMAIRATVHPKRDQLGMHMVRGSQIAPYNGVPLVDFETLRTSNDWDASTRIVRLWQLYNEQNIQSVRLQADTEPFFYAQNMIP